MSETRQTATQIRMQDNLRIDMRRARAKRLAAYVMNILGDTLEDRERDAYYKMIDAFYESGLDILSDEDRSELGLPPRDGKGWTNEEVQDYNNRLSEAMLSVVRPVILDKPKTG